MVSSPTAELWASLLNDGGALEEYIRRNREELTKAYEHLTGWLKFHGIPYIRSCAGHFLMADFRQVLSASSPVLDLLNLDAASEMTHREHALLGRLSAADCKVVLGPGTGFHMPEPGWLRLTFSMGREVIDTGLRRVEKALGWESWQGLGDSLRTAGVAMRDLKGRERDRRGVDSQAIPTASAVN
jgi:DNA-binding transcriptional MocR family regulator